MTQYRYIDSTGAVKGPVTFDELTRLRAAQEVTDATLVREEPDGEWLKLSEIEFAQREASGTKLPTDPADTSDEAVPHYFVWAPEKPGVLGPLSRKEITEKVQTLIIKRHHLVTKDTGAGAKSARATGRAETVGDLIDRDIPISRRSQWSTVALVLAILAFLISGLGLVNSLAGKPHGLIVLMSGALHGIALLFLAFLINVFTDIRWFLSKILAETEKS